MSGKANPAGRRRTIRRWLLTAMFASLLVNLALAVKIAAFDPNYPFHPICYSRRTGLVVLTKRMNEKFKQMMHTSLYNARVSRDGVLYLPLWDWWDGEEILWNVTRTVAVRLHEQRIGRRMTSKEYDEWKPQHCLFIGRYALD